MQILSQSESLGESLAYCGYSKEEIERVQKIATDSQKLNIYGIQGYQLVVDRYSVNMPKKQMIWVN